MELSAANCDDRLNPPGFDNKGVGAIQGDFTLDS
jgi:hypothetical protein